MKRADGFFWGNRYADPYCVVILDRARHEWRKNDAGERVRRCYVREYHAKSIRELRQLAGAAGWVLPRNVRKLCRTSATWVYWR